MNHRTILQDASARTGIYPPILGLITPLVVEPLVGARYLSTSHWLRDFFSWPDGRRREWQEARLQAIIRHARSVVPFYAHALGPDSGEEHVPLATLPVVDKETIRRDMNAFCAPGWRQMPYVKKRTGGTSGDPWVYPLDKAAWTQAYAASIHFWERTGYRYGERLVLLGSPPSLVPDATSWKARMRYRLERKVVTAAGIDISADVSAARAAKSCDADGTLWYGYAGVLLAMADAVAARQLPLRGLPRAIVSTSENLQPSWRRRIEEVFHVPLFDLYGCNDGGVLAQTCGAGRFHVAENMSIVEVLDGEEPCPPGHEGDITVTNLHAQVLPFIRYKVGDRGVLGVGTCPCGVRGVTFERLAGREADVIRLPGGRELSPFPLWNVFMTTPHVRKWQVIQTEPTELVVRIDPLPGFDRDESMRIESFFRTHCGTGVNITLTTTEPIERTAGGKHKSVIRRTE